MTVALDVQAFAPDPGAQDGLCAEHADIGGAGRDGFAASSHGHHCALAAFSILAFVLEVDGQLSLALGECILARNRGPFELKGFNEPIQLFEVRWRD